MGGATAGIKSVGGTVKISIHAPRGGSDLVQDEAPYPCEISIHAPRGGSDEPDTWVEDDGLDFNPRSPWGERPAPQR